MDWAQVLHDRLRQTCRRALAKEHKRWPTEAETDARVAEIQDRQAERRERRKTDARLRPRPGVSLTRIRPRP